MVLLHDFGWLVEMTISSHVRCFSIILGMIAWDDYIVFLRWGQTTQNVGKSREGIGIWPTKRPWFQSCVWCSTLLGIMIQIDYINLYNINQCQTSSSGNIFGTGCNSQLELDVWQTTMESPLRLGGVRSLRWKQRDQCQGERAPSHLLRTLEDLDPQIMTGSSLHVLAASGHVPGAKSTTWSTRRTQQWTRSLPACVTSWNLEILPAKNTDLTNTKWHLNDQNGDVNAIM